MSSSKKSSFFGRAWDRARGKPRLPALHTRTHLSISPPFLQPFRFSSLIRSRIEFVHVQSILTLCVRFAGKSDVERICKEVFEDMADKNTGLLDINSLHVATLMVYK
jgi:hypothetical protein